MTKEEWDLVKTSLADAYGRVHLVVDGFNLSLQVTRVAPMKYEICPYVNGKFEGRWLTQKTEEAVRFMRPQKVSLYSPKDKAALTKGLSKKQIRELIPNLDVTKTYYTWGWSSFVSLKRHLLANNQSIELKKEA